MRKWLILGAMLTIASFTIQAKETPKSLPGLKVVKVETVKKWLDNGEEMLILDARKRTDFEEGHIPEAESCGVNTDLGLEEQVIKKAVVFLNNCAPLKEINKNDRIVVYCNAHT